METLSNILAYICAFFVVIFGVVYSIGLFVIQVIIFTAPIWILVLLFGG